MFGLELAPPPPHQTSAASLLLLAQADVSPVVDGITPSARAPDARVDADHGGDVVPYKTYPLAALKPQYRPPPVPILPTTPPPPPDHEAPARHAAPVPEARPRPAATGSRRAASAHTATVRSPRRSPADLAPLAEHAEPRPSRPTQRRDRPRAAPRGHSLGATTATGAARDPAGTPATPTPTPTRGPGWRETLARFLTLPGTPSPAASPSRGPAKRLAPRATAGDGPGAADGAMAVLAQALAAAQATNLALLAQNRALADEKAALLAELESLTQALFTEANAMVADARRDNAVLAETNRALATRLFAALTAQSALPPPPPPRLRKLLADKATREALLLGQSTAATERLFEGACPSEQMYLEAFAHFQRQRDAVTAAPGTDRPARNPAAPALPLAESQATLAGSRGPSLDGLALLAGPAEAEDAGPCKPVTPMGHHEAARMMPRGASGRRHPRTLSS
ncbi:hypothetical protein CXG81DRAFT_17496 [Caulochytrium protostelioides]|uniref:GDP/GTP exchange factor Sec2 N-terminal domain-containing protein n=1 Tax=Caulochytrium protostelioides TaxID=1555241 RepID=A0A4P9XBV0_9FUNG|nr:hypothetical protein CXG81DRAFT_17496 [Caulochytrium protostelioides]|eukprot:RKP02875.1 hypothetical protein CXG81DRAFT_17496 [Caulochytrium protostelioides]